MSKSGFFFQIDDVTRAMSKGGGGACECPRSKLVKLQLVNSKFNIRPKPSTHKFVQSINVYFSKNVYIAMKGLNI